MEFGIRQIFVQTLPVPFTDSPSLRLSLLVWKMGIFTLISHVWHSGTQTGLNNGQLRKMSNLPDNVFGATQSWMAKFQLVSRKEVMKGYLSVPARPYEC